jgi:hypothetical protein
MKGLNYIRVIVNEIQIMEAQLYGDRQIRISSRFNRLVFGTQFEFQRLMVVSFRIVEIDLEF